MTWQLASLAVLATTLIGGVAWYERSRPPSQIVALVAALAALAVAGRVAFSPIPNVVPTTDIVILSGYALGAAPGFAVGALAGLVSNFWLGQGPWTPWQMAAWGLCGVFGAVLARATGWRLGRIGMAASCGFAGFAYGALLDYSLMVTYGGEQSLDRYLAISARGVPFNIAHAAGNVALALVAGPAIARMLIRYRTRFEFAWRRGAPVVAADGSRPAGGRAALGCALALGLAAAAAAAAVHPPPSASANGAGAGAGADAQAAAAGGAAGVAWLRDAENADGGFAPEPGAASDPAMTGWAALGLEAAGINPLDLHNGGASAVAYLRDTVDEIRTTGDIERTVLVLCGAGLDPRRFAGTDLVSRLRARRGRDGSLGGQVNLTAFSILALDAARSRGRNTRSARWLARARNPDGGWGFTTGAGSDPDSTGAALQALAAAGRRGPLRPGVGYLRGAQRPGGGFALLGGPVNAQSTAWAVQGLVAAGIPPAKVRRRGRSPLDYLASVQAADGHYRYSASSDQTPVWVTSQALAAVSGRAFPLDPVPRRRHASARPGGPGGGKPAAASAGGDAEKGARDAAGAAHARAKGETASGPGAAASSGPAPPASLAPASAPAPDPGSGDGGDALPWILAGSLLAVIAATWGGWLLYRRRLP